MKKLYHFIIRPEGGGSEIVETFPVKVNTKSTSTPTSASGLSTD